MEISKSAVLLANEQQSDLKNVIKVFSYKVFAMYSLKQNRLCQWIARKFSIKEDINPTGSLSIS